MPRVIDTLTEAERKFVHEQELRPLLMRIFSAKHYSSASFERLHKAGEHLSRFNSLLKFFSFAESAHHAKPVFHRNINNHYRSGCTIVVSSPVHHANLVYPSMDDDDHGDLLLPSLVSGHKSPGYSEQSVQ